MTPRLVSEYAEKETMLMVLMQPVAGFGYLVAGKFLLIFPRKSHGLDD